VAIFFIEVSFKRLRNEPPFVEPSCPIIPRITNHWESRSAGNIMWSWRVFKSLSEYISLVASDPGLRYFYVDLVIGFKTRGDNVSLILV